MLRRVCALVCALLALGVAALAEGPYCVVEGGVSLLADGEGHPLTNNGEYPNLFPVRPGSLYAGGSAGDYALLDAAGRELSDLRFDMIDDAGDALVFRRGLFYGAMDAAGSVILPAEWTQLTPDGAGGWLGMRDSAVDELPDALYHIAADGAEMLTDTLVLGELRGVFEDRMAFAASDGRWGYVNGAGETVIEPVWHAAGDFSGGRAIVTGDEGCGLIGADGETLIPPEYACLTGIEGAWAGLDAAGRLTLFDDISLEPTLTLDGAPLDIRALGMALSVSDGETARLLVADGTELCALSGSISFEAGVDGQFIAQDFSLGEEISWLVNPDGSRASGNFLRLLPLCTGRYAWMRMRGDKYFSEALGETLTDWDWRTLRWGLLDGTGKQLQPAIYRTIRALDDERLLLATDSAVILADRDGKQLGIWFKSEGPIGE